MKAWAAGHWDMPRPTTGGRRAPCADPRWNPRMPSSKPPAPWMRDTLREGFAPAMQDHVQAVFPHVIRHRLLTEDAPDPEPLLNAALSQTPVP